MQWTTKDGRKLNVDDMSDNHIYNALRMCHRNAEAARWRSIDQAYNFMSMLQGEMAIDSVESDINRLSSLTAVDIMAADRGVHYMMQVADKRGIKWYEHLT